MHVNLHSIIGIYLIHWNNYTINCMCIACWHWKCTYELYNCVVVMVGTRHVAWLASIQIIKSLFCDLCAIYPEQCWWFHKHSVVIINGVLVLELCVTMQTIHCVENHNKTCNGNDTNAKRNNKFSNFGTIMNNRCIRCQHNIHVQWILVESTKNKQWNCVCNETHNMLWYSNVIVFIHCVGT